MNRIQKQALAAVRDGADIYSYALAGTLRKIERDHPEMIHIGEPQMYKGDGTDRVPYFGAIATEAGRDACSEFSADEWDLLTTDEQISEMR